MDYTAALPAGSGKPPEGIDAFDTAQAAPEYSPLPAGNYFAKVKLGEYSTTKAGAAAYKMKFQVTEGPHSGSTVSRIWTFGEKALSYTKRDLTMFGLTTKAKLETPFPELGREYLVKLTVALKCGDDGIKRNDIKNIELVKTVDSPFSDYQLPPPGEGEPK